MELGDCGKTDLSKEHISEPSQPTTPTPNNTYNTTIHLPNKTQNSSDNTKNSLPTDNINEEEGTHTLSDVGSFVKDISFFFSSKSFSDVTIRIGQTLYPTHKFILAKSSRVFQTMLYGEFWNGDLLNGDELVLEETPECQTVFQKFLEYLYSAEVVVSLQSAVGLLCLADKYEVVSLKGLVGGYMVQWASSPRVGTALAWYNWAKRIIIPLLITQCFRTIAWNFSAVVGSEEWKNVDIDFLIDFVSSSELVVRDEFVVYEAVHAWLCAEEGRNDKHADTLLPLIRFPQMHVSQLYQLENNTNTTPSKLLSNLFSRAYRFRAVCPTQLGANFNDVSYLPRDYTYLSVDQVKVQNTMRFGIQSDVKAARSPVPCESKEAEWKITYRKQAEAWAIQLYCLDSALTNSESKMQISIVVYNQLDQVLHVHREETKNCSRGASITLQCTLHASLPLNHPSQQHQQLRHSPQQPHHSQHSSFLLNSSIPQQSHSLPTPSEQSNHLSDLLSYLHLPHPPSQSPSHFAILIKPVAL